MNYCAINQVTVRWLAMNLLASMFHINYEQNKTSIHSKYILRETDSPSNLYWNN